MTETYGYDKTPTPPRDYDASKVPPEIKKRATWVKTKFTGEDVAEAYGQAMEITGIYSDEAKQIAQQTKVRQDNLETQFDAVQQESTDKDVVSSMEIVAARGGKATLGQRLDETTAQLAQTGSDVANGLSKKETDQTSEINNYFSKLDDDGIRYAVFNSTDEFEADHPLHEAHKVVKIGNAKINKKNADNWFVHISKSLRGFGERVNSIGLKDEAGNNSGAFKQLSTALAEDRSVKVTFFGDSITAGSMGTPDTFENKSAGNQDMRITGDGIVANAGYPYRLMDMLKDGFPDTTFKVNNYGVGGTRLAAWDSTVTYWGITKKWIDFCKDSQPDVLVVSFGMNEDSFNKVQGFAYELKSLIEYVNENFNPVPDIVVIPTPKPVYVPGYGGYGNFDHHTSRFIASNAARAIAKEHGVYVCDVGRLSDIKRVGLDYTNPIMKKMKLSDFKEELNETISKKPDGSYVFTNGQVGRLWLKGNYQKDFTIKINLNFSAPTQSYSNGFTINFNKTDATGFHENRIEIMPHVPGGVAEIASAMRLADYQSWGDDFVFGLRDTINYGGDITLVISKMAEKVEVRRVNSDGHEVVLIQDYADTWDVPGYIEFNYLPTGEGNTATIKSIDIYGADYPEYLPALTENEMFGGFVDGDFSTKEPYGGNGVNHPSSIGITEVYVPALQEMVNDMVLVNGNRSKSDLLGLFPVTETVDSNPLPDGNLSYFTLDTKILSARVVSAAGVAFRWNKKITGWSGYPIGGTLGENEFAMYKVSDTQTQFIVKSPPTPGWTVTTYK